MRSNKRPSGTKNQLIIKKKTDSQTYRIDVVAMWEGGWWGRLGLGKEYQKEYEKECVCIVYGYIYTCVYK